jgi:PTS system beta-glucosides-specific IIC component
MLPVSFIVLGPLGNYVGVALTNGVIALRVIAGPLETMVVTALMPFLTAFGIGRPIFFACMTILMSTGQEYAFMPIAMVLNNWIIMGLSLGYMVRSKNLQQKQLGVTCFASNFLGGVSEPALFGILLPNKKLFLPVIIGGALGGLYLGIMNVGYFQMGASNFLSVMGFVGGEGSSNFIHGCIASGICLVATFASTLILFKEEKEAV